MTKADHSRRVYSLGLERMNDTGIGLLGTGQYLQILGSIAIGGYFFIVTPNTIPIIPIRQQLAPST